VLGRRMRSLYAYVPIASGLRVSIGIYSYMGAVTLGINADFDAFPDVEVLADGISQGMAELLEVAGKAGAATGDGQAATGDGRAATGDDQAAMPREAAPARKTTRAPRTPAKRASTSRP
jgi:diacylglycerol O-acyltransferase